MAYHQRPTSNDEGRPKQRTVAVALLFHYIERICDPPALGGPCLPLYRAGLSPWLKKGQDPKSVSARDRQAVSVSTVKNTQKTGEKHTKNLNIKYTTVWNAEHRLIDAKVHLK